MKEKSLTKIILIGALILTFGGISQAAKRGTSGSTERAEWCKAKLEQCKKNGEANCKIWHPQDNTSYMICTTDEYLACKNAYGSTSDCQTRQSRTGNKNILQPEELKISPDNSTTPDLKKPASGGFIRKQ